MERKTAKPRITELLSDHFSDTWKLLSETSWFLSRTPIFSNYENELRSWRRDLQNTEKGGQEHTRIRQEITYLRKSLREQGYDLGLARQNLIMEGFRNDASLGEGFRRVVIFFGDDDIYWLSGEDNHIILAELLERQMEAHSAKRRSIIRSRHYLWYRRRGNDLVLAGADTETKEDYERLKAMAEANSLVLLAKLRGLK